MTLAAKPKHHRFLSPIEEVVEDARNGRMFILVDAEERENEGDLVIPAQMATPDAINFMAKHVRGLICLALTPERAKKLHLELMSRSNRTRHSTAFTVSIEAREGVSTGISAHDRAHTVSVAIDPTKDYRDIMTRATFSRLCPRTAACWFAPVIPRRRSISRGSPGSTRPASSARS